MLAVHDGGCKHWPGTGRGHQHVFCFCCTRVWGKECDHSMNCTDPGVQQVRKLADRLEVGYLDGQAYLQWLEGRVQESPPTRFPSENVEGWARQKELGMT